MRERKIRSGGRAGFAGRVLLLAIFGLMFNACGSNTNRSVSGTVTAGGTVFSGVTVKLSGNTTMMTTTASDGTFSFSDVPEGTYSLTPTLSGYVFTPASRAVYLSGIDGSGFNFYGYVDGKMSASTHTLYLNNDSTLSVWGGNAYGQLGNGSTTDVLSPQVLTTIGSVTGMVTGVDHTVAMKSDGTVWAWGDNSNGQLGDGTTTNSATPVQVSGLSGVTAVTAGYKYSLALKSDGSVWAWGYNNKGQLGNTTTIDSPVPVATTLTSGITAIEAGFAHAVALTSDTYVWTWGCNSNGQLGNGTTTDSSTPASTGITALAIAAGDYHTLALQQYSTASQKVLAWGKNTNGQLGNATLTDSASAVTVSSLSTVVAIAAGADHSLAVLSDGTVWAWGLNDTGQLGNGTTTDGTIPVQVSGLSGIKAVAAGDGNSFALKLDNTLWAWGSRVNGRLGDGYSTSYTSTPVKIQSPE